MAASSLKKCDGCGQFILGEIRIFEGKKYCQSCYEKLIQERKNKEETKSSLYACIKQEFDVSDLPPEITYKLDRLLSSGKTLKDVQLVLWYYYKILGNNHNNLYIIDRVVNEQYDKAIEYLKKTYQKKQINDTKTKEQIVGNDRIVKINRNDNSQRFKNLGYKMEDL